MDEARNVFVITEEAKLTGANGSIIRRVPEPGIPLPAKVLLTEGEVAQLTGRGIKVLTEAEADSAPVVDDEGQDRRRWRSRKTGSQAEVETTKDRVVVAGKYHGGHIATKPPVK